MFCQAPLLRPAGRALAVQPVAASTPRHKGAKKARKNRPKARSPPHVLGLKRESHSSRMAVYRHTVFVYVNVYP